jgi:hypothetical protein
MVIAAVVRYYPSVEPSTRCLREERMRSTHSARLIFFLSFVTLPTVNTQAQFKQPPDVLAAYRVCETFQKILAKDIDFASAYEATFTKDIARRRAVALRDGEFGSVNLDHVGDDLVIDAYKNRMQLIYLMLPLAGPDSNEEERLFFPQEIKEILDRKAPSDPQRFAAYVDQLEQDVMRFRNHMDQLAREHVSVRERIQRFKTDISSGSFAPPKDSLVRPQQSTDDSRGLKKNEKYYEIEGYTVVREGAAMKIVSIRFFTRLF